MISRKYADDYRLEKAVNKKGKVVKKAIYIGPYYSFCADAATISLSRWICLLSCVVLWVCYGVCFVQDGAAPRQIIVAALFMCMIFPLIFLTWSSITLAASKPPFDRETSDDLYKKFIYADVAMLILSGTSCIGSGITLIVTHSFVLPGDAIFLAGDLIFLALSVLLFTRRGSFKTAEVERGSELYQRLLEEKEAAKRH